jgi:hypothetical protein
MSLLLVVKFLQDISIALSNGNMLEYGRKFRSRLK